MRCADLLVLLFPLTWCGCVGDAPTTGVPDASSGVDSSVDSGKDAGADAATVDAAGDAAPDVQAPCVDAGAPLVNNPSSGVQCDADGGALFCQKSTAACCVGGNPTTKCATKGSCGGLVEFACDTTSDCGSNMRCCLGTKGIANQECGGKRVVDSEGSHCAATCKADEITLCGGDQTQCFNGTCSTITLTKSPYKRISGCL